MAKKNNNPYHNEIAAYAKLLRTPGVYALNLCYEWACTSSVYTSENGPTLLRALDWGLPRLGENTVIAHQNGPAGEFYNITWPAVSGMVNGMAPGRFAAAINQAPMRRHKTGILLDWARNRAFLSRQHALPPTHLLRQVFETALDYSHAKQLLCHTPIALPCIYVLSGIKPNEGCIIERLEDQVAIRDLGNAQCISATNHFESSLNGMGYGWMPRSRDSHMRMQCAQNFHCIQDFSWFTPPIANSTTRLALIASAGGKNLKVLGINGTTPVTSVFSL